MMLKLLKKLKLWQVRRRAAHLAKAAAELRDSASYIQNTLLPQLEEEIRNLETDVMVIDYLKSEGNK